MGIPYQDKKCLHLRVRGSGHSELGEGRWRMRVQEVRVCRVMLCLPVSFLLFPFFPLLHTEDWTQNLPTELHPKCYFISVAAELKNLGKLHEERRSGMSF